MNSSFTQKYGPWALVTGAARGLGAAFARQLAANGLNLILVDQLAEELDALAGTLSPITQVRTLVLDLTADDALRQIQDAAVGLEVGLLINNAGRSTIGHFLDVPLEQHLHVLQLNTRVPLMLAHHFGVQMRTRQRGGIIFVSSGSAVVGTAWVSTYSASKAFLRNLGEALWAELQPYGVDVLATIVGATDTPGWRASNPDPDAAVWPPVMQAEDTVRETLAALGRQGPSFFPGSQNRLAFFFTTRVLSRRAAVKQLYTEMRKRYQK
ncbi:MAG: SDR family NAD(P)-dependent oxidoreductase [Anaerolineales bacterium]